MCNSFGHIDKKKFSLTLFKIANEEKKLKKVKKSGQDQMASSWVIGKCRRASVVNAEKEVIKKSSQKITT